MARHVVTAWRWTWGNQTSADFRSKRAAVDHLCAVSGMPYRIAEYFVYSVVIPIPEA